MKTLVFGKSIERAIAFLEDMIGEFQYKDIQQVRKSKNEIFVEMKDGSFYRTVNASQNARGHRCDRAYVDRFIDQEILDCVIKPMLVISKLPEEEQIMYF